MGSWSGSDATFVDLIPSTKMGGARSIGGGSERPTSHFLLDTLISFGFALCRNNLQHSQKELARCFYPYWSYSLLTKVGHTPPQRSEEGIMPLCYVCMTSRDEPGICAHHTAGEDKDWAKNNKIMNDGLLRNDWPKRLTDKEREEYSYE